MIKPTSIYILTWNLFATLVYLVSIFMDSLIIGFHLHPLLVPSITTANSILSAVMVFDIILKFFVAYSSNMTESLGDQDSDDDDEVLNTHIDNKVGVQKDDNHDDRDILGKQTSQLS